MDGRMDGGREGWEGGWMNGNYSEGKQEPLLALPGHLCLFKALRRPSHLPQSITDWDYDEMRKHLYSFIIPLLSPKVRSWTLRPPTTISATSVVYFGILLINDNMVDCRTGSRWLPRRIKALPVQLDM